MEKEIRCVEEMEGETRRGGKQDERGDELKSPNTCDRVKGETRCGEKSANIEVGTHRGYPLHPWSVATTYSKEKPH